MGILQSYNVASIINVALSVVADALPKYALFKRYIIQ